LNVFLENWKEQSKDLDALKAFYISEIKNDYDNIKKEYKVLPI